jgi:hypothetical protein
MTEGLIDRASPCLDVRLVFVMSWRSLPSLLVSNEYQQVSLFLKRVSPITDFAGLQTLCLLQTQKMFNVRS